MSSPRLAWTGAPSSVAARPLPYPPPKPPICPSMPPTHALASPPLSEIPMLADVRLVDLSCPLLLASLSFLALAALPLGSTYGLKPPSSDLGTKILPTMGNTCEDLLYIQFGEKFGGGMKLPGFSAIRDFFLEQFAAMQRSFVVRGGGVCVRGGGGGCMCVCVVLIRDFFLEQVAAMQRSFGGKGGVCVCVWC